MSSKRDARYVTPGDGLVYVTRAEWLPGLTDEWREPEDYSYNSIGPPPFG
ncbi:MAG: hypothetical protein WBR28_13435 [Mycobacterium sp.]